MTTNYDIRTMRDGKCYGGTVGVAGPAELETFIMRTHNDLTFRQAQGLVNLTYEECGVYSGQTALPQDMSYYEVLSDGSAMRKMQFTGGDQKAFKEFVRRNFTTAFTSAEAMYRKNIRAQQNRSTPKIPYYECTAESQCRELYWGHTQAELDNWIAQDPNRYFRAKAECQQRCKLPPDTYVFFKCVGGNCESRRWQGSKVDFDQFIQNHADAFKTLLACKGYCKGSNISANYYVCEDGQCIKKVKAFATSSGAATFFAEPGVYKSAAECRAVCGADPGQTSWTYYRNENGECKQYTYSGDIDQFRTFISQPGVYSSRELCALCAARGDDYYESGSGGIFGFGWFPGKIFFMILGFGG